MSDYENQGNQNDPWEQDPLGYLKSRNDNLESLAQQLLLERQQAEQRAQLNSAVSDLSQEFSRKNPDYGEAVTYGIDKQLKQYQAAGLSLHEARQPLREIWKL